MPDSIRPKSEFAVGRDAGAFRRLIWCGGRLVSLAGTDSDPLQSRGLEVVSSGVDDRLPGRLRRLIMEQAAGVHRPTAITDTRAWSGRKCQHFLSHILLHYLYP